MCVCPSSSSVQTSHPRRPVCAWLTSSPTRTSMRELWVWPTWRRPNQTLLEDSAPKVLTTNNPSTAVATPSLFSALLLHHCLQSLSLTSHPPPPSSPLSYRSPLCGLTTPPLLLSHSSAFPPSAAALMVLLVSQPDNVLCMFPQRHLPHLTSREQCTSTLV